MPKECARRRRKLLDLPSAYWARLRQPLDQSGQSVLGALIQLCGQVNLPRTKRFFAIWKVPLQSHPQAARRLIVRSLVSPLAMRSSSWPATARASLSELPNRPAGISTIACRSGLRSSLVPGCDLPIHELDNGVMTGPHKIEVPTPGTRHIYDRWEFAAGEEPDTLAYRSRRLTNRVRGYV